MTSLNSNNSNKRRISRQTLPVPLPSQDKNELVWLVQPTAVTFMRYNYTLIQSKIFVRIIGALQENIQEAIYNHYNKISTENTLFSSSDFLDESDPSSILLKIPMNSFGVHRNQYRQLKEALKMLVTIPVEIPVRDKNQKIWREFDNLCSVRLPESGRVDNVYIKIKKTTATMLLNMEFGFTKFLQYTILSATNAYTPRFCLYLSAFAEEGGCTVKMESLRRYLRLENSYSEFKDFVKRVIVPAQKEMKEMAHNGKADFYFEYDKQYAPGKRKAGEPDNLVFKIINTYSLSSQMQGGLELKKRQVNDLLRGSYILMDEKMATEISNLITIENHLPVLEKISQLVEFFAKPDCNVIHKGKYVYSTIKNLVKDMSQTYILFLEEV